MKRTIRTEEQLIGILHEHEHEYEHETRATCADLCRKHGISEGTFYAWKAKYFEATGGADQQAKRLKALEGVNLKLKKLLAEQMLELAAVRKLVSKK